MRQRLLYVLLFSAAIAVVPLAARGELPALNLPKQQELSQDLGYIGSLPGESSSQQVQQALKPVEVGERFEIGEFKILNTATGQVENIPVRDYVRGAVAAELPASFHSEAMKAQAVAAHTYALYNALLHRETPDPALKGADFAADPDHLKGFAREEDIKATYGSMADEYWSKITDAADSVMSYILVYEDEPIMAVYHSCSVGTTEAAENVWQASVPYLLPVESEGDLLSPAVRESAQFTTEEMRQKLAAALDGLELGGNPALWLSPVKYSDSGYILQMKVGNQTVSGREIRSALGLRSSSFEVDYDSAAGIFTVDTLGYGHGVGLSQYGADYMARQGSSFEEILTHYYTGAQLAIME